ncbi:NmrA family transcriptional regulator [Microbacterium bovistercoris]|uniref:NmrA family transcriptional regulator n=1 Tax=Microbacterium bovistercoris TaxID=2293570 RepID=A0A371NQ35_9MICO|nr:NAD(P)H-binding protein [Microbacterium bovistercoris]REJ04293.1 NmrA family transcriptional regulator [Microbacterium bovistercoris]
MRIAVAGGTGRIGRLVVALLSREGVDVVSLSRGEGVDLVGGAGLAERLTDVEALIDVSNPAAADAAEAERVYTAASENLLAAGAAAGVRHHVALSIAAIDAVQGGPHYFGKRAQERTVRAGAVPYTIVRATQFHDFPAMIADRAIVDGEAVVPPLLLQPIAPADVASVLVEVALGAPDPAGIVVAGPRTEDAVDMARRTFAARGADRAIRASWAGAALGLEFSGEVLLPPAGARIAPTSFDAWLAAGAR